MQLPGNACAVKSTVTAYEHPVSSQDAGIRKWLRVMKLTMLFLFIGCLAAGARTHAQTVSLSFDHAPVEDVFREIKKQTGYEFLYGSKLLQVAIPVTITVKNTQLEPALKLCFKDQPFTWTIVEKTIVLQPTTGKPAIDNEAAPPPPIDVHGRIVDGEGKPVAASVQIKSTNRGTTTNDNGEFELKEVDNNAVLVISGVGIQTFEWNVNGKTDLGTLSATIKTTLVQGVQVEVNTGYQKVSPQNFVGSYSQLDSATYNRRAGMDIISRLDGTMAGLLFDKKRNVNSLESIQIRGVSTLDNSHSPSVAPLIIVDNFPFKQDLSALNPNDIESITVLKDATAASIWGAQAGNGVIVITTKKGKYNQPLHVSASSNITVKEKPDLYYYPQMSSSDFIDAEIFLFGKGRYDADLNNTSSWPIVSPVVELLAKRRAGMISAADSAKQIDAFRSLDLRSDLNEYVYRPSIAQQHYVGINGGSGVFNYNFNAGYNRSLNNIQNSKPDDQITLSSNVGVRLARHLELTTTLNYTQGKIRNSDFSLPSKVYPYAQLADAEGRSLYLPSNRRMTYLDTAGNGQLLDWRYNPLDEVNLADRNTVTKTTMMNIGLSWRINSWLTSAVNYQYTGQASATNDLHSVETFYTRNLVNLYTNLSQTNPDLKHPVPVGGILDISNQESNTQQARAQLNVNKRFGIKHNVSALVAAEVSETKGSGENNRMYGYSEENGSYKASMDYTTLFPLYGNGVGNMQVQNSSGSLPWSKNRFVSFLGNASYTYNGIYTLYASARKDGSNVFGVRTNKKWKPLWSVGSGWDISKENFYNIKWMPSLRLRLSYGYTGNPGNASGLATILYASSVAVVNFPLANPNDPPNPDLRWERVGMFNAGFDFSLLKSRITGSIDMFQKNASDLISNSPLPLYTGVLNSVINIAKLRGRGFELNLNSDNINGPVKWRTSFGLSYTRTIVTKLYTPVSVASFYTGYGLNAIEGRMVYGLVSYKWGGLDPATGNPLGILNKQTSTNYTAIFNDSIQNQVFHGSSIPLYSGFILNAFSWKQFSLSVNLTYRLDFYFRKPTINYSDLVSSWKGHIDYEKRWQQPGDEKITNVPSFTYPIDGNRDIFYQSSEINVLRGDNIRVQDLRLQYDFNKLKRTSSFLNGLSVFVYVNDINLILWRKNDSNLDPDFVGGSGFIAPTPVSWTAGARINL